MKKMKSCYSSSVLLICVWFLTTLSRSRVVVGAESSFGSVVKREERSTLVRTEYGEISAARVTDNINGSYLLHFFTLEPNSLFLPVILHADMVFYIHTGSGKLQWTEEDELKSTDLSRGDAYRLQAGSIFFIQSNLETEMERQKLRIHAIFANSDQDLHEPITGPYSSITDMVLGFDKKVLLAAFKVSEEDIEELVNGTKQPAIIHGLPKTKRTTLEMEAQFIGSLLARRSYNILELNKKKKKGGARLFNLLKEDKDFENCNGWSTTVTRKKLSALKGTNIGLFMVNLTIGSMMGPHWNPMASEISVVLQGRGMVRVVCSNETGGCRNMRYEVEEGDVFVVPRFHAMAQMAFNNETFVFMGFSTSAKRNHPQYLAGQASVLRTLDKDVLGMSLNVTNTTVDQLLGSQEESVILGCVSCAEEELSKMEEEREKEREEAREREEEEARKREEEEARREEEERKRREEEARREEEERKRKEEEEEEARREEEERKRREEEEEEAARRKEEEERKRREEEEEEEEAARRKEEEEARKRREEEEEEAARRKEEEEARKRREEEEEEEEEAARRKEEEEARKRWEEEEEEEARKRREEEEEAARRQEEEARKREEEAARREEEEREREEEEEAAAARRREKKEERKREEEEAAWREEEERRMREEEEVARREEEERRRERHGRRSEEEEVARREEEERRGEEEEVTRREEEERRREEEEVARREEEERRRERHGRRSEEEEVARREEEERRREEEEVARREEEEGRRERHGRRSEEEEAAEEERRREEEAEREAEEEEDQRG